MGVVLPVLLMLWVTKPIHGMHTTVVAWIGVSVLLITHTLKNGKTWWQNDKAWETLIWIGGLLTMARSLKEHGFIDWFAQAVGAWFTDVSGITVLLVYGANLLLFDVQFFDVVGAHCRDGHGVFSGGARRGGTGDAHGRHIRVLFQSMWVYDQLLDGAGDYLLWSGLRITP